MAEQLYGLTKDDVAVLKDLVASWRRGELGRPLQQARRTLPPPVQAYVGIAHAAGISAMSGSIAGAGEVTLCTVTTSGLVAATSATVTGYNLSDGAVVGSAYVHVKREALTGRMMIDFERCT